MTDFSRRVTGALVALFLLTVTGTVGYILIEDWPWYDAVYMSAITLTAVGYEEVHPLTEAGRSFTMILLLGGITWMGVWFALITSFLVELDLRHAFQTRRIMKEIEKLSDHIVICGSGRTGRQVAEELAYMGQTFVVIERDPDRVEALMEADPEALVIHADATVDQTLKDAGVERAKGLIASLSADTDNLFVCLSARDLNQDLIIVARAYDEGSMSKMYRAGADHVVSPNVSSAVRMASVMLRPTVLSFLDVATRSPEISLRLEEATITEGSSLAGSRLADARIPEKTGLIVIAVRKGDHEEDGFVFNPGAETRLQAGDVLVVLGESEEVSTLRDYVGG